ncbi:19137_t:CDS:2, partial [Dentiscutata erythropus]
AEGPWSTAELINYINSKIEEALKLTNLKIDKIEGANIQPKNVQNTMLRIKRARKTVQKARNLKNLAAKCDRINKHIERRYTNFKENTKCMVNSILKKDTTGVTFTKLATSTKLNLMNENKWKEWEETYKTARNCNKEAFNKLDELISLEEFNETMRSSLM